MSDFLTRLAERTVGVVNTVQPLIGSRFAPGPRLAVTPHSLEAEPSGESETGQETVTPSHMRGSIAPVVLKTSTLTPVTSSPAGIQPPPLVASMTRDAISERVMHTEPTMHTTALDGANPSAASITMPDTQVKIKGKISSPLIPSASDSHAYQSEQTLYEDTSRTQDRSPGSEQPSHFMLVPEPIVVGGQHTGPVLVPQSLPPGEQNTGLENMTVNDATHLSPEVSTQAIHVTIGRVEVRAVLPETKTEPPPFPTRQRPPLSLDEYLRQRKGGPQ